MKLNKTLASLLTAGMLLSPLSMSSQSLTRPTNEKRETESYNAKKIEVMVNYVSSRLTYDNYLEEYRDDLKRSIGFWKKVFTTDSSKAFIVNPYNLNHGIGKKSEIEERRFRNLWVIPGKKQYMKESIKKSYKHLDYIIDSLDKHNLPVSLSVVPLYESGFRKDAVSSKGAVGMWQFMEWTARRYGLEVNHEKDERLNPKKSTSAFIKYYKDSKKQLKNPLFALVSFNVGRLPIFRTNWAQENPIKALRSGIGFNPRVYPSIHLACKDISMNPRKYYPFIFHNKKLEKLKPLKLPLEVDYNELTNNKSDSY